MIVLWCTNRKFSCLSAFESDVDNHHVPKDYLKGLYATAKKTADSEESAAH